MIDQQTDVSKLSDAELLALIGQQPQAQPATPQQAPMQQGPGEGLGTQYQQPVPVQQQPLPDLSQPREQAPPDFLDEMDQKVRALARGVPVAGALADEGNAAILAGVAPYVEPLLKNTPLYDPKSAIGDLPTFKDRYDAALNLQRFRDDSYDAAHPTESKVLRGVGTVGGSIAALPALAAGSSALPATAGLLPRMLVGGLEGGAVGSAQGYAEGAGGFDDPSRLGGAVKGGILGAGVGGAFPVATTVGGAVWRNTGQKAVDAVRMALSGAKTESQALAEVLKGGAASEAAATAQAAPELARMVRRHNGVDYPIEVTGPRKVDPSGKAWVEVTGDTGSVGFVPEAEIFPTSGGAQAASAPGVAEAVANASGPIPPSQQADAYSRLALALERQGQTPEQMAARVGSIGPNAMIADTGDAVRTLGRDAFNRPSGAEDIIRKALEARQRGVMVDGEFAAQPSSMRILDAASEGLGVNGKAYYDEADNLLATRKAAAQPAYAKAYEAQPVDIGELREFAGTPLFQQAYQRARGISEKEFVTLPDGTEGIMPLSERFTNNEALDWRTLDLMKQGLDDLVKEGKVQGIGANEQGAIKRYAGRFVEKLDSLNPDYRAAREAFAGPTAMMDALEAGRTALREDTPVMARKISNMTPAEQDAYRLGAFQALKDKLGNADVTYDAARQAGVLKPNQLERFKELFPDRKKFADFVNLMANEQTMFQTRSALMGNSTTAKQLAAMSENDAGPVEQMAQGAVDLKTGNVLGIIRALGRAGGQPKMSPATAESLASILTNTDQSQLPIVVQHLTEAQKRRLLAEAVRGGATVGAESGAASAAQPKQ